MFSKSFAMRASTASCSRTPSGAAPRAEPALPGDQVRKADRESRIVQPGRLRLRRIENRRAVGSQLEVTLRVLHGVQVVEQIGAHLIAPTGQPPDARPPRECKAGAECE